MTGDVGAKEYLDYRDMLWLHGDDGAELQRRLGITADGVADERQCVVLSITAAVMWAQAKEPPTMEAVQKQALGERLHIWEQAAELVGALGELPPRVTKTEADLRVFAHDALAPHHDKAFRYLVALEMPVLRDVVLHVWLLDYWAG